MHTYVHTNVLYFSLRQVLFVERPSLKKSLAYAPDSKPRKYLVMSKHTVYFIFIAQHVNYEKKHVTFIVLQIKVIVTFTHHSNNSYTYILEKSVVETCS